MKQIEINGRKIEIYDSIEDTPIKRFHKFNKYALVDSGVGSDLNDLNAKIGKIMQYLNKADIANGLTELENMRQGIYLVMQETNVKHLSFMALVKSVDGKEITDLSHENLVQVQKLFEDTKLGFFENLFESIKKKLDTELKLYFPGQFDSGAVKEYYERVKSKILLELDTIIRGTDNTREIDLIDDFLLLLAKPNIFSGHESIEIKYDKQFEDMCLYLSKEAGLIIEKTTVLQFYNSFDYLKKQKKRNG